MMLALAFILLSPNLLQSNDVVKRSMNLILKSFFCLTVVGTLFFIF